MKAWTVAAIAALTLAGSAGAHDFWIQPARFRIQPGETTSLAVLVGHGTDRARWRMRLRRIVRFASIAPDGRETDRRAALSEVPGAPDAALRFDRPGLYVVALETNNAANVLPADKFDEYLADEGLNWAIEARRRDGMSGQPGRERYSRRAKALVQVGAAGDATRATRPIGLTLEITPEIDPYRAATSVVPVRVTYQGKPLPGARVLLTALDGATSVQMHATDRYGRATFRLPTRGPWQFHTAWTRRLRGDADAEFETVFSSLTIGSTR